MRTAAGSPHGYNCRKLSRNKVTQGCITRLGILGAGRGKENRGKREGRQEPPAQAGHHSLDPTGPTELGQPQMWDRVPHGDSRQGGGRWGGPPEQCFARHSLLEAPWKSRRRSGSSFTLHSLQSPLGCFVGWVFLAFFFFKGISEAIPSPLPAPQREESRGWAPSSSCSSSAHRGLSTSPCCRRR